MRLLVTGGTGFIGSHACADLLARGHEVTIVDNLANSRADVVERIAAVAGRRPRFIMGDVRDRDAMLAVLRGQGIEGVLHFAALKAVAESWEKPLAYYDNNVGGSLALLHAMQEASVDLLVFSSSATVYGDPEHCPVDETAPRRGTNPYARTKLMTEDIIADIASQRRTFRAATLRYFNPAGAHPSGLLGEEPSGVPNNLMPYVAQVAAGERSEVQVFGGDYPTPDGTGVRDYIHVVDLARAHSEALEYLVREQRCLTVNLGTGRGYSVLDVITAFERACGRTIPRKLVPRRSGDVAACYADASRAFELLGWRARLGIERMCEDAWRWQSRRAARD
ncbi:UDP-glucose 4-epimerase GalE [Lysobacter sp. N42]|uniref:UDP-glucose 4-epimerase GalE n=1 Tax=Lysobacter sp. N42 TaxID=2545719 RepID=UPI0010513B64|nr:UDP-glucose 4-epimerase GalE [Lysobacter sp. N42]TCZ86169.1 UDP-glucose 4-epimerase GalE [Lysobacter sp. N42]